MDPVVPVHSFLFSQSLIKAFLCLLKGLLSQGRETFMLPITRTYVFRRQAHDISSDGEEVSYLVPLRFLHLFGLPLCGEDETGTQCRYSPLSDGLLGVPHCIKDVVKEGLHLLKEEGRRTHSQLPQHQHLKYIKSYFLTE